ncbi:MAG: hypothetical protein V1929_06175 [bacterium]
MKNKLKAELGKLPEDVQWHLRRSDGFLDLRMTARARAELDRIDEAWRGSPFYLNARMRLAFEEQDWKSAADAARALADRMPGVADYLIQLAYATRRSDGIAPAQFILEEAQKRFPDVAVIAFNLACYECQEGRRARAMEHLQRAIKLDPHCRAMAMEDEDLKPLWPMLEEA